MGGWGVIIKGHVGKPSIVKKEAYNLLVVRVSANGQLCDSKPCCMCVNLMRLHGVKRVYYSNVDGEMCCQKISQLTEEIDGHFTHGLRLMIQRHSDKKFPLTKLQKNYLIRGH